MLSTELMDEFILDCSIRNLSKRTIETYEMNIGVFLEMVEYLKRFWVLLQSYKIRKANAFHQAF